MPKPIYQQDIERYREDIRKHGVTGVIRVYTELQEKGHGYAGWMKGVKVDDKIQRSSEKFSDDLTV